MQQHVFERAGLGRAPFHFVGVREMRGPLDLGNGHMAGSPGQPMGTCAYCGTGIAECCIIRDADGKEFMVGTTCVDKTGDAGLLKPVKAHVNEKRKQARHEREARRIADAQAKLPQVEAALKAQPHPYDWLADQGKTALDFVQFMFQNAGNSGMLRAARLVEKVACEKRKVEE